MKIKTSRGFQFERDDLSLTGAAAQTLISDALAGLLYLNLHSETFPSGEVRAQLFFAGSSLDGDGNGTVRLTGGFSGGQEVPLTSSKAVGTASVIIEVEDGTATLEVQTDVRGLSTGKATAFHIHSAPFGSNGGVLVNLDPGGALASDDATALDDGGFNPIRTIVGTSSAEEITGNKLDEQITARAGADVLNGKGGDDTVSGGGGNDTITGGSGADFLSGDGGKDRLVGNGGNDSLLGGAGKDVLLGGAGGDSISGGAGNDVIRTGGGRDTVIYEEPLRDGTDTIADFNVDKDRFVLDFNDPEAVSFDTGVADGDGSDLDGDANILVLTGENDLDVAAAAALIADNHDRVTDGAFVYFDAAEEAALLVYSDNLNDPTAQHQVLAKFLDDVDDLLGLQSSDFVNLTSDV